MDTKEQLLAEFEKVVYETLETIPDQFKEAIDNVALVVEDWPTREAMKSVAAEEGSLLFGLYQGVPKTQRGIYYSNLPDKITVYAGPIIRVSPDFESVKTKIKETVMHELGHHFGMSEHEIRNALMDWE